MSEHRVSIQWGGGAADHVWEFAPDVRVAASSAPDWGGSPGRADPEQALTAALASCHMLTFLAVAKKDGLTVLSYRDDARGILDRNEEGRWAVTRILLRPAATFAVPVDEATLRALHDRAHRGCFIARSIRAEVLIEPVPA